MATGIEYPQPQALDSNGVNHLSGASLPDVTSSAWAIAGQAIVASFATQADPRPDAFAKTGFPGLAHDLAFHDRIHVIPRNVDVGFVISERDIEVEVWNAFFTRAKTLTEITESGPAGVEIIDHLGTPAHFAASVSEIYEIKVLQEGDPTIDNVITWVFVGIDSSGTDCRIIGFRIVPWPFEPNANTPLVEIYGFLTDIIEAFNGSEQRVQLREKPNGSISYAALFNEPRDAQMAMAIMFGNQARAFGVGRWQFRRPLTAPASVDDVQVYCDTTNIPFEPDGLAFLWVDPYTWEAAPIESVESDHLVLKVGLSKAWAADVTEVIPLVVGRLSEDESLTWESMSILSSALTFDIDGFKP
jgi:hypothetical protein